MELTYTELEGGMRMLRLAGRLDVAGAAAIETRFAGYCAVEGGRVLVDMAAVDFMSSIGIRMLVLNANALVGRGGKMVLLNPTPNVRSVLEVSGIPSIIPMYDGLESAVTLLSVA